MGIVQLATRLNQEFGDKIEIGLIDGGISTKGEIIEKIEAFKPDLVGISVLTPTYEEGLKIAQAAKTMGAKVVLGDDHAIFFPEKIIRNRPYVDFIIANDVAEQPLVELVNSLYYKRPLDSVCSLVYRDKDTIKTNPSKKYLLKTLNTVPDLNLISDKLSIYSQKYYEAHGQLHGKKINVVTINNARGCENGVVRCSYCSIADLTINTGDPRRFWETIGHYHAEHGINLFFEVYDSFTSSPVYIDQLLQTMPKNIRTLIDSGDIEFMIYARALGLLKRDNVQKFKRLGVKRVNIGLDSGDTKMLEAQRKNKTTNQTNLMALKALKMADMSVHGSFILGALGETRTSVENTVAHIIDCMEKVDFSSVEVSRLYPLPNSPIWDILVNAEHPQFYKDKSEIDQVLSEMGITIDEAHWASIRQKYCDLDLFNFQDLMNDWYENFTHVEQSYVLEKIAHLDKIIQAAKIRTGKNVG